jgi:hypothetical protein
MSMLIYMSAIMQTPERRSDGLMRPLFEAAVAPTAYSSGTSAFALVLKTTDTFASRDSSQPLFPAIKASEPQIWTNIPRLNWSRVVAMGAGIAIGIGVMTLLFLLLFRG